MNTGEVFSCPVGGWLDNGANPAGPGSRKVNCKSAGKHFEKGFTNNVYRDKQQNENLASFGFLFIFDGAT